MNLTLITGAARSGKSKLAEQIADEATSPVIYIATMEWQPQDAELVRRIEVHKKRRPAAWRSLEIAYRLHETIDNLSDGPQMVLIDCLSVYVSNLLLKQTSDGTDAYACEASIINAVEKLLQSMQARRDLSFLLVTNEVGWSIVPESALGRAYRDFLGQANQLVSEMANEVWLTVCGQKLRLKPQ